LAAIEFSVGLLAGHRCLHESCTVRAARAFEKEWVFAVPVGLKLIVRAFRDLTPAIRLFRLGAADGSALPAFTAGSHIKVKVRLPDGAADERHYSLINSAAQDGEYQIAVQHETKSRGGSAFMHGLAEGDALDADGPHNDFALAVGARLHVLIAGGIGITPILSMARALRIAGQPFEFYYAARLPELMALRSEVEDVSDRRANFCFDGGDPSRGLPLESIVGVPDPGRHIYVCGPKGMLDAVLTLADKRGWPKSHVHFESFGATEQIGDSTIEVQLKRDGRTLTVTSRQTILDALLAAGIDHPHDCKRGECSTCQVEVLDGVPDNRDYCLFGPEYDEGKLMCVCVSRAKTPRLVLDI
jgi:ferredoxin-NADP reductase